MPYFSGQGRVYIGARDITGKPQGLNYVGNVPEHKVSLSVETLEHQESTSGQRLTYDLKSGRVESGGGSGRIKMTIQPTARKTPAPTPAPGKP